MGPFSPLESLKILLYLYSSSYLAFDLLWIPISSTLSKRLGRPSVSCGYKTSTFDSGMNSSVKVECEQEERHVWVEVDGPLVERWRSGATTKPAIYGDPSLR